MSKNKSPMPILPTLAVISLAILISVLFIARSAGPASADPSAPPSSVPSTPAVEPGWKTQGTSKYYTLSDGTNATGWQEIDGKIYYFHSSGIMATGWLELDGQSYYLLDNGEAASGTLIIDDTRHHFTAEGAAITGWFEYEGKEIYLDSRGTAYTGWQTIDALLYCFDEEGFPRTGWQEYEGKSYFIIKDGSIARGRTLIEGQAHYFTSTGDEILLVNPWNELPHDYTVKLRKVDGSYQVAADAYPALQEMLAACKAAKCTPVICSAYRSQEYQENLFKRKVKKLKATGLTQEEAEKEAGTVVAVPGTSEHQLGYALDIIDYYNWNLDESQEKTKTQQWLMEHSWEYGWILRYPNGKTEVTGIIYEPWHYRYVGKELAAELHELDLCLEEYLQMLTDTVG